MMRRIAPLLILFLFVSAGSTVGYANQPPPADYGLAFRSHTFNQDGRTGLDLSPDGNLRFKSGFTLSFDLLLTREDLAYGYVFRIVSGDEASLDMTSNINNGKINFVLAEGLNTVANLDFQGTVVPREGEWMHVQVAADAAGIECSVDSAAIRTERSFPDFRNIKIYFGRNRHPRYFTTDVPPMVIRDISITSGGDTLMNWKLSKHNRSEVFDSEDNRRARVENGVWEIDKHTRWRKAATMRFRDKNPQIAYDEENSRLFIATSDSVAVYGLGDGSLLHLPVEGGAPFRSGGSHLIYDTERGRLISYSILFDQFVEYDFAANRWSDELSEGLPPIQHHSRYIDRQNRRLVVFGGYGNHTYNAELAVHDLDGGEWRKDTLADRIPPRYLCAMGYRGDGNLLVMGGYGSESGRQEESPRNLYDLYDIDIDSLSCRKLAGFDVGAEPLAMGNSMVCHGERIYTLAFNNNRFHSGLFLMSMNLPDNCVTCFADTIPYRFLDTESYADLIFNHDRSKLYAVVLQARQAATYDLELYSLSFPPLDISAVRQQASPEGEWRWAIVAAGLIAASAAFWIYRSRRRKTAVADTEDIADISPAEGYADAPEEGPPPSSEIFLLGGLQIFGRDGRDITADMTPVVRQIFLLILLNSADDGKGITSQKLDETFWMGMDKTNASNNRNVNIRKLRLQLQEIGDISLLYNNGYWYLQLGEGVGCDYIEAVALLKKLKRSPTPDRQTVERILAVASRGLLLPNTNYEWMDRYKSHYSNMLMDTLLKVSHDTAYEQDNGIMLLIARTILLHDCIDEDAIRIQCRILYRKGQKGQSKQAFDRFCEEYERMLGTKPDLLYEEVISNPKQVHRH